MAILARFTLFQIVSHSLGRDWNYRPESTEQSPDNNRLQNCQYGCKYSGTTFVVLMTKWT